MNADIYKKIAIETAVKAGGKDSFAFVLASSNPKVDCRVVAEGLSGAFEALHMNTLVIDASETDPSRLNGEFQKIDGKADYIGEGDVLTEKTAQEIVSSALSKYVVSLFITKPLHEDETAMLLTAACGQVVLTEQKKLSRTDSIEKDLEIIRNLQAKPIGFILK